MRVLLLTQVLPYPLDSGPRFKTYHILKYLAERHEVTLASFIRAEDDQSAIDHLKGLCHAVYTVPMTRSAVQDVGYLLASLLTHRPFVMLRDERQAMRALVRRLGAQWNGHPYFDVVHADQLNMATYALDVPARRRVLGEHDVAWALWRRICATLPPGPKRWLLEREWRLLRHYQRDISRHFDAILTVSEVDRAAMAEAVADPSRIEVLPIAIDPGPGPLPREPDGPHILHLGTMFYLPNADAVLWFTNQVYPRIRARLPQVRFSIVGTHPPPEVRALANPDAGINVTGYVPDVEPIIRRSSVLVVPLRAGSGMRVKILNALAQGLPVVTTTLGCEGIAAVSGRDLLVADTPEAFAEAVLCILTDEALARSLAANGRRLIEQLYDYRIVCRKLEDIYRGQTADGPLSSPNRGGEGRGIGPSAISEHGLIVS